MIDTNQAVIKNTAQQHNSTTAQQHNSTTAQQHNSYKCIVSSVLLSFLFVLTPSHASDDNLGCTFLLCLGSPDPLSIAECVSPIKTVLKRLSKGKGFPSCTLSNGLNSKTSGNYVTYNIANPTPQCPDGYHQGQDGVKYHAGVMPQTAHRSSFYENMGELVGVNTVGVFSTKYPDEDNGFSSRKGDGYSQRVCLKGNNNGSIAAYQRRKKDDEFYDPKHEWYDSVVVMKPDGATYEFTMFTDNKPFSKHRF